jgi:hypothetical protein
MRGDRQLSGVQQGDARGQGSELYTNSVDSKVLATYMVPPTLFEVR